MAEFGLTRAPLMKLDIEDAVTAVILDILPDRILVESTSLPSQAPSRRY